jgi:hypothetical protein
MNRNYTLDNYFFQNDSGLDELSNRIGKVLRKEMPRSRASKSSIQMLINYACSLELVKTRNAGMVDVLLN